MTTMKVALSRYFKI